MSPPVHTANVVRRAYHAKPPAAAKPRTAGGRYGAPVVFTVAEQQDSEVFVEVPCSHDDRRWWAGSWTEATGGQSLFQEVEETRARLEGTAVQCDRGSMGANANGSGRSRALPGGPRFAPARRPGYRVGGPQEPGVPTGDRRQNFRRRERDRAGASPFKGLPDANSHADGRGPPEERAPGRVQRSDRVPRAACHDGESNAAGAGAGSSGSPAVGTRTGGEHTNDSAGGGSAERGGAHGEVAHPTAKHGIDLCDHPLHGLGSGASGLLGRRGALSRLAGLAQPLGRNRWTRRPRLEAEDPWKTRSDICLQARHKWQLVQSTSLPRARVDSASRLAAWQLSFSVRTCPTAPGRASTSCSGVRSGLGCDDRAPAWDALGARRSRAKLGGSRSGELVAQEARTRGGLRRTEVCVNTTVDPRDGIGANPGAARGPRSSGPG